MTQLIAQYNASPDESVSEHIVQRTLMDMGLCSRRPTRVPLLTKRHRQLTPTVGPGTEIGSWINRRVSWSDVSRIFIHHVDGRVKVYCLPGYQSPSLV